MYLSEHYNKVCKEYREFQDIKKSIQTDKQELVRTMQEQQNKFMEF